MVNVALKLAGMCEIRPIINPDIVTTVSGIKIGGLGPPASHTRLTLLPNGKSVQIKNTRKVPSMGPFSNSTFVLQSKPVAFMLICNLLSTVNFTGFL